MSLHVPRACLAHHARAWEFPPSSVNQHTLTTSSSLTRHSGAASMPRSFGLSCSQSHSQASAEHDRPYASTITRIWDGRGCGHAAGRILEIWLKDELYVSTLFYDVILSHLQVGLGCRSPSLFFMIHPISDTLWSSGGTTLWKDLEDNSTRSLPLWLSVEACHA